MLFITKRYEVRNIDFLKFILIVLAATVMIAMIAALFNDIPNSINLAISLPLSLIGTFIWEFFISKKNKLYDEDSIEDLLDKIEKNEENYIRNFSAVFFKIRNGARTVLKVNKDNSLDEVELLLSLIQPCFLDLRHQLQNVTHVEDLYKKVKRRKSALTRDYKVNFDNLAFIYDMNLHYVFHYHSIQKIPALTYNLSNHDLKILQSFMLQPVALFDGDMPNPKFPDHPFKKKYYEVFYNFYTTPDASEDYSGWDELAFIRKLYDLFLVIKDNDLFVVLKWLIAYDIIMLSTTWNVREHSDLDVIYEFDKLQLSTFYDVKEYFEIFFAESIVFNYFYQSHRQGLSYFKDNQDDFAFSQEYDYELERVYRVWLEDYLLHRNIEGFLDAYRERVVSKCKIAEYDQARYKVFYEYYAYGKELNFSQIDTSFTLSGIASINERTSAIQTRENMLLQDLQNCQNPGEVEVLLERVFNKPYYTGFFKFSILYQHLPVSVVGNYVRKD